MVSDFNRAIEAPALLLVMFILEVAIDSNGKYTEAAAEFELPFASDHLLQMEFTTEDLLKLTGWQQFRFDLSLTSL